MGVMTNRTKKINEPETPTEVVVEFPKNVTSADDTDQDFGPPLSQLLIDLDLKGTAQDAQKAGSAGAAFSGTPDGVAILEAGATAAAKGWSTVIAALGGITAIGTALEAFWEKSSDVHSSVVIGGCVVIAACALAIGLIFYGDLVARGRGAAAQYHARASVADSFIAAAQRAAATPPPPAASVAAMSNATLENVVTALVMSRATGAGLAITLSNGTKGHGKHLCLNGDGKLVFQLDDESWFPITDIAEFGTQS